MNSLHLLLILSIITSNIFAQAREDYEDDNYKKIYSIILLKDGEIKQTIKQGAMMSSKVDGRVIKGRWYFKAYPDVVSIIGENGEELGEVALNKEILLRITPPQQSSGLSVGIGFGPVSVSSLGSGMKNFNMKKYRAEIRERPETKTEKLRRETYLKKEKERKEKEAAKKAKKEAKIAAKKEKKK